MNRLKRKSFDGKKRTGLFVKGKDGNYYCTPKATKYLFDAVHGPRKRRKCPNCYLAYLIAEGLAVQGKDGNYYPTSKAAEILKKAVQ